MMEVPALRVFRTGGTLATEVCGRLFAGFGHHVIDMSPEVGQMPGLGDADILLCDLTTPESTPFGSGYESLLSHWPGLVVTSITCFGLSGSLAGQRGDSLLAEAYGGLSTMIGEPDRRPLALGGEQAAYASGIAAFLGSCLALLDRNRRGRGQLVDVAMCDVMAYMDWKSDVVLQAEGAAPARSGTDGSWKLIPCADGHVGVIYQPEQWDTLCELVGSDLLRDASIGGEAALVSVLRDWARNRKGQEIYRLAQDRGLPFGYCANIADLLQSEQYRARRFFRHGGHDDQPHEVVRLPLCPMVGAVASARTRDVHKPGHGESIPVPGSARVSLRGDEALPLHGTLVLDLGTITAGAAVGRLLADYGATVVKVEAPQAPDPFRFWNQSRPGGTAGSREAEASPFFESNNVNKLGLAVNLKSASGRKAFLELARQADVVLENFSVGVTSRLGIGSGELRKVNPRLVYLSLSSQGQTGPEAGYRSYGSTIDLLSGLASVTGYGPGEPLWSSRDVNYPDQIAALFGAAAVVHALCTRTAGPLDISQREVVSWTLERYVRETMSTGVAPVPSGNNRGSPWTRDTFPTADGRWIAISCLTADDENALCSLTGTGAETENPPGCYAKIAAWTSSRGAAECLDELARAGIPSAAVLDAELRAATGRFYQRRVFEYVPDGPHRGLRVKGAPFVMSRVKPRVTRHAPSLGQDTEEIMEMLLTQLRKTLQINILRQLYPCELMTT